MKHNALILTLLFLIVLLAGCGDFPEAVATTAPTPETSPSTQPSVAETTVVTESAHSPLFVEGLAVEDVIRYFNEVCLDAEIINSGNASLLQKWISPIYYRLNGDPTEADIRVMTDFAAWLNTVEGFPGMVEAQAPDEANLQIHFCTQEDMLALMGQDFTDMDGAVTFWYLDNAIYDAIICCRTDLDQQLRNSAILEEIYNGLGPIQDTDLRPDSIIYSEYAEPQELTEIDALILKLLYHPQLLCGMNGEECEAVIRQLYW